MRAQKRLFITLFLLCLTGMATAQDVIVMKDQSTIMSKVLEITSTEIKYKKWNNQNGPTYSISHSEVASINYENGEVENFSNKTQQTFSQSNGYMDVVNGSLKINGHVLTEMEIRDLVDPQNYQLYLKAEKQSDIGFVLNTISTISLITSGIFELIDLLNDNNHKHFGIVATTGILWIVTFVPGVELEASSVKKLRKIAEEYNKKQGLSYSLNISPSLIRCEIPQSQGNCGLGLTMSMNF